MSLPALRQQLAAILPPSRAGDAGTIPTGIGALDGALSDGGIPRGRLTEIQGARGSGRTTLVRHVVGAAVAGGQWVAVIDGSRTLAPREWAEAGDSGRLWVIRPPEAGQSAWCADILLRSGTFSLVVLDGAPALPRQVAIRLTRLAKEHDVALVIVGDTPVIGSAVRLRVKRARGAGSGQRAAAFPVPADSRFVTHDSRITHHASRITICIDKGGSQHAVEVSCAIEMARRLRAHPEVPDRRGVAARNRRGEKIASPHRRGPDARPIAEQQRAIGATLPRKRRFAEAYARHDGFALREGGRKAEQRKAAKRAANTSLWPPATGEGTGSRATSHQSR